MDRSYKEDIPKYRAALLEMKEAFGEVESQTDWVGLRVDPLLSHVSNLERLLKSPKFERETTRLRRGVAMFHADLVYLRANVSMLKTILADEKRKLAGKARAR